MADIKPRYLIKRATTSKINSSTDNLLPGDQIFNTDTKELFIGYNTTPANSGILVANAKNADNATNVTGKIKGVNITGLNSIFEDDGRIVKNSTTSKYLGYTVIEDLNAVYAYGNGNFVAAYTALNSPPYTLGEGYDWYITVEGTGNKIQHAYGIYNLGSDILCEYKRLYTNGTWRKWELVDGYVDFNITNISSRVDTGNIYALYKDGYIAAVTLTIDSPSPTTTLTAGIYRLNIKYGNVSKFVFNIILDSGLNGVTAPLYYGADINDKLQEKAIIMVREGKYITINTTHATETFSNLTQVTFSRFKG